MSNLFADATPAHAKINTVDLSGFTEVKQDQPIALQSISPVSSRAVSTQVVTRAMVTALAQRNGAKPSSITTQILSAVKASESDELGLKLNQLVATTKKLDPTKMGKPSMLGKLLNFGGNVKEKMLSEYQSVEQRMNVLGGELDKMASLMSKRAEVDCEQMYTENEATYIGLDQDIVHGNQMLTDARVQLATAPAPKDGFEAQHIADQQALIADLEKVIDDFKRGQQLCLLAAPQIRMQQAQNRTLAQSVKTIQTTTIPAWQGVFSRYILAMEAKKGAELVNGVYDATDAAFRMQADLLRSNTVEVAKAQQRSVVSTDTLMHMQEQLLGAVDDALKIAADGKAAREADAPKLKALEQQMISRFTPLQITSN